MALLERELSKSMLGSGKGILPQEYDVILEPLKGKH